VFSSNTLIKFQEYPEGTVLEGVLRVHIGSNQETGLSTKSLGLSQALSFVDSCTYAMIEGPSYTSLETAYTLSQNTIQEHP